MEAKMKIFNRAGLGEINGIFGFLYFRYKQDPCSDLFRIECEKSSA